MLCIKFLLVLVVWERLNFMEAGINQFFENCTKELVKLLRDYSTKVYGEIDKDSKYILQIRYEKNLDYSGDTVSLQYRYMFIKYGLINDELVLLDINNVFYADMKNLTKAIKGCVNELTKFNKKVYKLEGVLGNCISDVCICKLDTESDLYNIILK